MTKRKSDILLVTLVGSELHVQSGIFRWGQSDVTVTANNMLMRSVGETVTVSFVLLPNTFEYAAIGPCKLKSMSKSPCFNDKACCHCYRFQTFVWMLYWYK
jgi:hypothetical protein